LQQRWFSFYFKNKEKTSIDAKKMCEF